MDRSTLGACIRAAYESRPELVVKNARVINVFTGEILKSDIAISGGLVIGTGDYSCENEIDAGGAYVCPGFIDGHVHIESSHATPSVFAQAVLPHGTTSAICDPHEIVNVLGARGMRFMLNASKNIGLSAFFMLPSCVPATSFENNGSTFLPEDMREFISDPRVLGLAEVMDVGSVTACSDKMLEMLLMFENARIDGHAPLLTGSALAAYRVSGAATDHECSNTDEVVEKLRSGMTIHLRMGSAASSIDDIITGLLERGMPFDNLIFCTDDKSLRDICGKGHINTIMRRAVELGVKPLDAIRMATINTARTYKLNRIGAVAPGYRADLVFLDDLESFRPLRVLAGGRDVSEIDFPRVDSHGENSVHLAPLPESAFWMKEHAHMPAIELIPGKLITKLIYTDTAEGFNKVAVIERHKATGNIGLGLVKGFSINGGAIASTVAHDSHNIVIAGDNDADMRAAALALEHSGGGYAVVSGGRVLSLLSLPIAGLMSDRELTEIIHGSEELQNAAYSIGVPRSVEPFDNLSFLALPVIPAARITDLGMFDSVNFEFLGK